MHHSYKIHHGGNQEPVTMGTEIRAEGRVLRTVNEREAFAEGSYTTMREDVCARATGTFATINPEAAKKLGIADDAMFRWFEEYNADKKGVGYREEATSEIKETGE